MTCYMMRKIGRNPRVRSLMVEHSTADREVSGSSPDGPYSSFLSLRSSSLLACRMLYQLSYGPVELHLLLSCFFVVVSRKAGCLCSGAQNPKRCLLFGAFFTTWLERATMVGGVRKVEGVAGTLKLAGVEPSVSE